MMNLEPFQSDSMIKTASRVYDRLEHLDARRANIFVVNWCLANTCNYTCSYCPDHLHDGSIPFPEYEKVLDFCREVRNFAGDREVFYEFTGGEVTLWKELPRLLTELNAQKAKVMIISNGSRSLNWWKEYGHLLDQVCLSFHAESADPEHFLEVVRYLAPRIRVHCNFMMSPELFEKSYNVATQAVEIQDVTISLQPLFIDFKDQLYGYSLEQKKILENQNVLSAKVQLTRPRFNQRGDMLMKKDGQNLLRTSAPVLAAKGLNRWRGWKCAAGNEQIVVDYKGQVFRGWCLTGGALGNIHKGDVILPDLPTICDKDSCDCNFDMMTTKSR